MLLSLRSLSAIGLGNDSCIVARNTQRDRGWGSPLAPSARETQPLRNSIHSQVATLSHAIARSLGDPTLCAPPPLVAKCNHAGVPVCWAEEMFPVTI